VELEVEATHQQPDQQATRPGAMYSSIHKHVRLNVCVLAHAVLCICLLCCIAARAYIPYACLHVCRVVELPAARAAQSRLSRGWRARADQTLSMRRLRPRRRSEYLTTRLIPLQTSGHPPLCVASLHPLILCAASCHRRCVIILTGSRITGAWRGQNRMVQICKCGVNQQHTAVEFKQLYVGS